MISDIVVKEVKRYGVFYKDAIPFFNQKENCLYCIKIKEGYFIYCTRMQNMNLRFHNLKQTMQICESVFLLEYK